MQLLYVTRRAADDWLIEALRQMGHAVETADWTDQAAELAEEDGYDILLADAPRADPADLAPLFEGAAPVVLVVDAADAHERSAILRAGADACLTRPLHLLEVESRLMALTRAADRRRASDAARGGLRLDRPARRLALGERSAALSPTEFRLVAYLFRRQREVVEVGRLDRHLFGAEAEPRPERVQALVSRLRRKLGRELGDPLVHGVAGHGYVLRLDPPPETAD